MTTCIWDETFLEVWPCWKLILLLGRVESLTDPFRVYIFRPLTLVLYRFQILNLESSSTLMSYFCAHSCCWKVTYLIHLRSFMMFDVLINCSLLETLLLVSWNWRKKRDWVHVLIRCGFQSLKRCPWISGQLNLRPFYRILKYRLKANLVSCRVKMHTVAALVSFIWQNILALLIEQRIYQYWFIVLISRLDSRIRKILIFLITVKISAILQRLQRRGFLQYRGILRLSYRFSF